MPELRKLIHIVADFTTPGGGREHALGLKRLLARHAEVVCWSEFSSIEATRLGCRIIRPFSREYPHRGTLIVLGPQRQLAPWAEYSEAERIIIVCNASEPEMLYRQLAYLGGTRLPEPELSFVSRRLRDTLGLEGAVNISPVPVEDFLPRIDNCIPVIGRHSRDMLPKHHPGDMALYRQFSMQGLSIKILGGKCLVPWLSEKYEGISLLPFGAIPPNEFLRTIDIYFYRTAEQFADPAPRAVIEALAAGCAIVASPDAGITDWIEDGTNGFLVNSDEEAYCRIIELANDKALISRLGQAAKSKAIEISGPARLAEVTRWYLS